MALSAKPDRADRKAHRAVTAWLGEQPDAGLTEVTVRLTQAQLREVDALREALNRGVIGRRYDREDVLLFCVRETVPGLRSPQTSYAGLGRERPIRGRSVG